MRDKPLLKRQGPPNRVGDAATASDSQFDPIRLVLTPEQFETVELLVGGLNPKQIANQLMRGRNTIYDRLARARIRLGASTNQELVAIVHRIRKKT